MASYFVAYGYFRAKGMHGFGNIGIERAWPISGPEDIADVTEIVKTEIQRQFGDADTRVVIIGWQPFETDVPRARHTAETTSDVITLRPQR